MFVWPYVTKYNEAILDYDNIPIVKNIYTKYIYQIYLIFIYFTLSTLQKHLHIYVLNNNSKQF